MEPNCMRLQIKEKGKNLFSRCKHCLILPALLNEYTAALFRRLARCRLWAYFKRYRYVQVERYLILALRAVLEGPIPPAKLRQKRNWQGKYL